MQGGGDVKCRNDGERRIWARRGKTGEFDLGIGREIREFLGPGQGEFGT